MKIKRVQNILFNLNLNYPKGFVEYWDNCKPNEWQFQLNEIEKSLVHDSDEMCLRKLDSFEITAHRMMKRYADMQQAFKDVESRVDRTF